MKSHFAPEIELYDGSQLASLFAYQRFGILGDSIVGWIGPCNVTRHMVDAEDQRAGAEIRGGLMLHFIVEVFNPSLAFGVSLQRLFATLVSEVVGVEWRQRGFDLRRDGDDLFVGKPVGDAKLEGAHALRDEGKWSISIATRSPVSTLMHFALNVTNTGTPVKTWSLEDLGDPKKALLRAHALGPHLVSRFVDEYVSILQATQKVHPVTSYQLKDRFPTEPI